MLELNISTILLEMANFFLLVFILNLFLFKPIQSILKQRENEITNEMDEAKRAKEEADKARQIFEEKTNNIDAEVAAKTNEARIVIEHTRQQMLQEVQTKVDQLKHQTEEKLSQMQTRAIQQHKDNLGILASDYAKGILSGVITPQIKTAFKKAFFDQLLSMDLAPYIQEHLPGERLSAQLILPDPLEKSEKERLETAFNQSSKTAVSIDYEIDPNLIAGGVLRFENELIDGSVLGQINRFKQQYQEMA